MRMAATSSGATVSSRLGFQGSQARVGRRVGVATEVAIDVGEGGQMDAGQERLVAAAIVRVRARHAGRAEGPTVEAARKATMPGRPVTRRAILSAPSIASEPELRKKTVSNGSGISAAIISAKRLMGSAKPTALGGAMSRSTCAWMAAVTAG